MMTILFSALFAAVAAVTPAPQSSDATSSWQKRHAAKLEVLSSGGSDIIFLGDDLVALFEASYGAPDVWKTNWAAAPYGAVNLGFQNDYTENVLWRITEGGELDGYTAKVVVVEVGHANLKYRGDSAADTVAGVSAILDAVKAKQPTAKIVLCAIVPQYATRETTYLNKVAAANVELAKLADGSVVRWCGYDKTFERLASGYIRWTGAVMPFVNAVLRNDVAPVAGEVVPIAYSPAVESVNADTIINAKTFIASNAASRVILQATGNAVVDLELAKYSDGRSVIWCGSTSTAARDALVAEAKATDQLPVAPYYDDAGEAVVYDRVAATTPVTRICESSWRGSDWWGDRLARNRRVIRTSGGKIDFVFAGDSITHFWEDYGPQHLAALKRVYSILNCGYGGDQTQDVLWRFQNGELDGYTAKAVMLLIGTNNNGINGYNPTNTAHGVEACVTEIKNRQPTAKIILMAYLPRAVGSSDGTRTDDAADARNTATMAVLRETYADDATVQIVDIGSSFLDSEGKIQKSLMGDYIHPTEAGYGIWSDAVVPTFKTLTGIEPSDVPASATYTWGKSGDSYDGRFDDPAHWTGSDKHAVPNLNDKAYVGWGVFNPITMTFPEGVYNNYARFAMTSSRAHVRKLDLSQTIFRHAENTEGTYSAWGQFQIIYNDHKDNDGDYSTDILNLNLANATPNLETAPHLELSNTVITVQSPAEKKMTLDFDGGVANFDSVLGHAWTSTIYPRLYVFNFNNNGASAGAPVLDEAFVSFRNGASLRARNLCLQGNAATNVLSFSGGRHTAQNIQVPGRYDGQNMSQERTVTDIVADQGADIAVADILNFMEHAQSANRVGRLIVRGASHLSASRVWQTYGESELIADGGTIEFLGGQNMNKSTMKSAHLVARNGGVLLFNQSTSGTGMYLGNGDVDGMGLANVDVVGATFRVTAPNGKFVMYYGSATFGEGSLVDANGAVQFWGNASRATTVAFDGATVTNTANMAFGTGGHVDVTMRDTSLYASGTEPNWLQCNDSTLEVENTRMTFAAGSGCYLGYEAAKTSTMNFRSGTVDHLGADTTRQFYIGCKGTGRLNVYGGTLCLGRVDLGGDYDAKTDNTLENVLDIEGGLVDVRDTGNGLCANGTANRTSRVILNGGVLNCCRLYKTAGTAHFEADGGTLRANANSTRMIRDLDSAQIGAKGLTIDNAGHDIDLDVAFANKTDARGRLTLTGSGTTSLNAALDVSGLSELVLSNVTVQIDVAHTVTVGALVATDADFAFATTPAIGSYPIFSLAEEPSAATKAALEAIAQKDHSLGTRMTFQYSESEGRTIVTLVVRAATVTLLDGTRLNVKERSQLGENIRLKNGVLAFEDGDFTCDDEDFFFSQETTNDHVIVEAHDNVTLPLPRSENQTGGFTKRGAGTLTMKVKGVQPAFNGNGTDDTSTGYWCERVALVYPMLFDAETGFMTNGTYGAINVIEGEMRLVGEGTGATIFSSGHLTIARPSPDGTVSPGLVLDNVAWTNDVSKYVSIASGLKYSTPITDEFADEPYLILTNGASLYASTLFVNRLNKNTAQRTHVRLYDSTALITYLFSPNLAQVAEAKSDWEFVNSSLYITSPWYGIQLRREVSMVFDHSVWAKNSALDPTMIETDSGSTGWTTSTGTFVFRNGSKMCCSQILVKLPEARKLDHPVTFVFDDSEWIPTSGGDYAFSYDRPEEILVVTTNKGLRVSVPAGCVWTFSQPVTGPGDFTQAGAGTVCFNAGALAYTGATRALAGGSVDFGGNAFAATLAGAGAFANGTVADGGIRLDPENPEDVPTLASTLAFTGKTRVDLGYDGQSIPQGTPILVARYEGAAPDVSSWRLKRGTMMGDSIFAVDEATKTITVTPQTAGMMIIVR